MGRKGWAENITGPKSDQTLIIGLLFSKFNNKMLAFGNYEYVPDNNYSMAYGILSFYIGINHFSN